MEVNLADCEGEEGEETPGPARVGLQPRLVFPQGVSRPAWLQGGALSLVQICRDTVF